MELASQYKEAHPGLDWPTAQKMAKTDLGKDDQMGYPTDYYGVNPAAYAYPQSKRKFPADNRQRRGWRKHGGQVVRKVKIKRKTTK